MTNLFRADGRVTSQQGQAVSGASISILSQPSGLPAALFDASGNPMQNPLASDGYGRFHYYTSSGLVTEVVTHPNSLTQTFPDIALGVGLGLGLVSGQTEANSLLSVYV